MTDDRALYAYSSARENVLEHLFVGKLLQTLWCKGVHDVEVLRSEVDDCGYDLVIECQGVLRHVQLKSSHREGKASRQTINSKISGKSGGCVVWMLFDAKTLELGPFRWLEGQPSQLGNKIGRHAKANSKGIKTSRPNTRVVTKKAFSRIADMDGLVHQLFGDIKSPKRLSA